jgi:acyl-CoA thioesterase-1
MRRSNGKPTMNWLVYHIASGQSFFSGLAMIVIAAAMSAEPNQRLARFATMLAVAGVLFVVVSSTAIPYWLYGLLAVSLAAWLATQFTNRGRRLSQPVLIAACLLCAAVEVPFHVSPTLGPVTQRSMAVVGDSVSAGLGEQDEVIWPTLFEQQHRVKVLDLSHVGETAGSASKRARQQAFDSPLVLVEIGGNDVLGSTTAPQFGQDLEALLVCLTGQGRQVFMFELPLPPFYHEYGRIQREAARRHDVLLVPKRVFLGLLAEDGATLDSIHLSQAGHQRMSDVVWELVGPAFE